MRKPLALTVEARGLNQVMLNGPPIGRLTSLLAFELRAVSATDLPGKDRSFAQERASAGVLLAAPTLIAQAVVMRVPSGRRG